MAISGAAIAAYASSAAGAATIATVATVAATAVSVYSSVEAGKQKSAEMEYNARISENNAAYQNQAAVDQAAKIRKVGQAEQASANAALAGSGVKLGEGSAVDINRTIGQNTEQDAYNTLMSGKRAVDSGNQTSTLLKTAGSNATANSYIGAGATILGSAATLAKGWKTTSTTGTGKVG